MWVQLCYFVISCSSCILAIMMYMLAVVTFLQFMNCVTLHTLQQQTLKIFYVQNRK
jgi:hypothetical protein